jgi:hypothetical protein
LAAVTGVSDATVPRIKATKEYIAAHNKNPKPLTWTATAQVILAKVIRADARLSSNRLKHYSSG